MYMGVGVIKIPTPKLKLRDLHASLNVICISFFLLPQFVQVHVFLLQNSEKSNGGSGLLLISGKGRTGTCSLLHEEKA